MSERAPSEPPKGLLSSGVQAEHRQHFDRYVEVGRPLYVGQESVETIGRFGLGHLRETVAEGMHG